MLRKKMRRRKIDCWCGWRWSGSCCCDHWRENRCRLSLSVPSLCLNAFPHYPPSHYGTCACLPRALPPSLSCPVCVDILTDSHHIPPFLYLISPLPSLHVLAAPPELVSLAAAASPALCGGTRPASPGCGDVILPHLCLRIRILGRYGHPHPRSHLNHSHRARLPQQSPQVVECWKLLRSALKSGSTYETTQSKLKVPMKGT